MKYFSYLETDKSFAFQVFDNEAIYEKYVGRDKDSLSILNGIKTVLNSISEDVVFESGGKYTEESYKVIKQRINYKFEKDIVKETFRYNVFSQELKAAFH